MLGEATTREAGYIAAAPRADLIGAGGVAITDLRPAGAVEVAGERLDVVADGKFIPAGTRVTVVRSDGYRHVVAPEE
jgi:membrane-bound serine protease (ClpP class)